MAWESKRWSMYEQIGDHPSIRVDSRVRSERCGKVAPRCLDNSSSGRIISVMVETNLDQQNCARPGHGGVLDDRL